MSKEKYNLCIKWICIAMAAFQVYVATVGRIVPNTQCSIHLVFALLITALLYPMKFNSKKYSVATNLIYIITLLTVGLYIIYQTRSEYTYILALYGPSKIDIIAGSIFVIMVLESARRTTGWALPTIAITFLTYALIGSELPGLFGHKGYSWTTIVDQLVFTSEGVFGQPLMVSSTFVAMFILFGAFLSVSGAGQWFIDMAYSIAGKSKSGPAMAAVVSSAAMGTISGTGPANVVTTGTFTIPLMKKCGYNAAFAGAVEAAASSGGQIMPPVMGAGAFIMAEILGKSYGEIALAALFPAVLYFYICSLQVHIEACKCGFKGLPKEQLPNFWLTLKKGVVFLVPIIVLVWAMAIKMYSPSYSAVFAIAVLLLVAKFLRNKNEEITTTKIYDAMAEAAKNMLPVALACGTAGIMIGILLRTGLALRFTAILVKMSGDSVLIALILTMFCCIFMGMGMPTTAAFIVTSALGAPALIKLGILPLAAYMFIFYFACLSSITPPVAIAAYAAAGISGAKPLETAMKATKLGLAGFLIPYFFCFEPSLLLQGSYWQISFAVCTSIVGSTFLAIGLGGYLYGTIKWYERSMLIGSSLLLVHPDIWTTIVGLPLTIIALVSILKNKKVLCK